MKHDAFRFITITFEDNNRLDLKFVNVDSFALKLNSNFKITCSSIPPHPQWFSTVWNVPFVQNSKWFSSIKQQTIQTKSALWVFQCTSDWVIFNSHYYEFSSVSRCQNHNAKLCGGNAFVIQHKMKKHVCCMQYLSIKTSVDLEFQLGKPPQLKRVFEVSGSYYGEKLNKNPVTADAKVIWKKIAILYVSVFKFSVNTCN